MLTLALDTSTARAGLALAEEGRLLAELNLHLPRRGHAEKLIPALQTVLGLLDISISRVQGLAVTVGPGSFTGLRVGVSTARAWAQVLDLPLIGVSTLDVLAAAVDAPGILICPLLDARQGYLYTALYRRQPGQTWPRRLADYRALRPQELWHHVGAGGETVLFIGDGVSLVPHVIASLGERSQLAQPWHQEPRAGCLALRGEEVLSTRGGQDLETVVPLYVRPAAAVRNRERQRRARDGDGG